MVLVTLLAPPAAQPTTASSRQGSATPEAARWAAVLAPWRQADNWTAVRQLVVSLGLFAASWWVMARALTVAWWLALPLAPLAAFLFIRLFIFQHDCGHGSFFTSTRANDLVGFWLGVFSLTPYRYWKRTHAIHHATSGNLDRRSYGDIRTFTVAEYRALPLWRRAAYRLYRNPLVMFVIGPAFQFGVKHRLPFDAPFSWTREWRGVAATNLALAAAILGAAELVGWFTFLVVHGLILAVGLPLGIWLFYVQHQFEDAYWQRSGAWDFQASALAGSSFYDLGPVLHWLTGNIGYHHLHHLASRIPNYRLAACYRALPELHQERRLSLGASFRCLHFKLWDEANRRMIGWRELRRSALDAGHASPRGSRIATITTS